MNFKTLTVCGKILNINLQECCIFQVVQIAVFLTSPRSGLEEENLVLELGSGTRKIKISTVATPTGTPPGLDLQTGYI